MKLLLILIPVCIALCSCSSLNYTVLKKELSDPEDLTTYSATSDIRLIHVLKGKDGKPWILTEPPPDAAFSYQSDEKFDMSLVSANIGNDKSEEDAVSESTDLPLTGRAAYVVFARELLFRLNEMSYNTNMTATDYQKNYQATLEAIKAVALLEAKTINQTHNVSVTTQGEVNAKFTEDAKPDTPEPDPSTTQKTD